MVNLSRIERLPYTWNLVGREPILPMDNRQPYQKGSRVQEDIVLNKGNKNSDLETKKLDMARQAKEKALKRMGLKECQTCKNRRYQDVSNDPGVSMKTPTYVPPSLSGIAVTAHENQHVAHERARAEREGKKIVYQSVQLYLATCPECGRIYVAGGRTYTVSLPKNNPNESLWPLGNLVDLYA